MEIETLTGTRHYQGIRGTSTNYFYLAQFLGWHSPTIDQHSLELVVGRQITIVIGNTNHQVERNWKCLVS